MNIALLKDSAKYCCFPVRQNSRMHVGDRLKQAMAEERISVQQMAAHCAVTPGAVSNWFATGRITKSNLLKAAELVERSMNFLISGEEGSADPFLATLETEWAKRSISPAVRESIMQLVRSSPLQEGTPTGLQAAEPSAVYRHSLIKATPAKTKPSHKKAVK